MSAFADLYRFDQDEEDWVHETNDGLWGPIYFLGDEWTEFPCGPTPSEPFTPHNEWFVVCGLVPEKQMKSGAINVTGDALYGVLSMNFTSPGNTCTEVLGICPDHEWTHLVP
jgi:hypothetical protein